MITKTQISKGVSNKYSVISTKTDLFNKNIWSFEELGFKKFDIPSSRNTLNFENLLYPWLIDLMKDTIWRKRNAVGTNTLISYVRNLCSLVKFSTVYGETFVLKDITSTLMEAYFTDLQSRSPATQSAYFSGFHEIFTCWQEWGVIPRELRLLPRDMRPRDVRKKDPRALSPYVQQKLIAAITPPTEYLHRILLILLEVGARGQEILHLKKDSLHRDSQGWYLTRQNKKFNKDITVPISDSVAEIIKSQIAYADSIEQENDVENKEGFLFTHIWSGQYKLFTIRNINYRIKKLFETNSITDELGRIPNVSTHSFRHTVGTNLINNGVSQHHVQKFLGHESPQMTSRYAEIHDSTMRDAIIKSNDKMTDIRGRLYSIIDVATDISPQNVKGLSLDAQWLRRNISTQTLPNGVCALPNKTSCSHANACLTCPSFRTGQEHRKTHEEQKKRTVALIDQAGEKGYVRQVEINSQLLININNILGALKSGE